MPLMPEPQQTPEVPPFPEPNLTEIVSPKLKSTVVSTTKVPLAALLQHIEGSAWTVDYFSQYLTNDEELSTYQPSQLPPYQQYLRIRNYELKVTSPISPSFDATSGSFNITGTAIIYPFHKPNVGDTFIADVGDGRSGIFNIVTAEPKTWMQQTCYEITFTMTEWFNQAVFDGLLQKTIKTVFYNKDYLTYGQNPVLTEAEVNDVSTIDRLSTQLFNRFMQNNYSTEYRTLVIPGQQFPSYDPFVVKTILSMYNRDAHPTIRKIRELNVDGLVGMEGLTLWDALLYKNEHGRDLLNQQYWMIPARMFSNRPAFDGIAFSGLSFVVYPNPANETVDTLYDSIGRPPEGTTLEDIQDMDWDLESIFQNTVPGGLTYDEDEVLPPPEEPLPGEEGIPPPIAIHPVLIDTFYVFTHNFYHEHTTGQSQLELLTNDFLNNRAVDRVKLLNLANLAKTWGKLEQYYYIPVLLILLNEVKRSLG